MPTFEFSAVARGVGSGTWHGGKFSVTTDLFHVFTRSCRAYFEQKREAGGAVWDTYDDIKHGQIPHAQPELLVVLDEIWTRSYNCKIFGCLSQLCPFTRASQLHS